MQKSYQIALFLLFFIPCISMGYKLIHQQNNQLMQLFSAETYAVTYQFEWENEKGNVFVKSFLPTSNTHQQISAKRNESERMDLTVSAGTEGKRATWRSDGEIEGRHNIEYQFHYSGKKMVYELADNLPINQLIPNEIDQYLLPEEYISWNKKMQNRAEIYTRAGDLQSAIKGIYNYCYLINRSKTARLTTAEETFAIRRASCNGKSRLFVAMCRSIGIPARTVGGLILNTGKKRTSHLWAEVYVNGVWVPFDTLNGHFATLPANYLELYKGDYFLITRSKDIDFDYEYQISKISSMEESYTSASFAPTGLIAQLKQAGLSHQMLTVLLLLPLVGLVTAIIKNVIGIKTIGNFLPALIGLSFYQSNFWYGLISFLVIVFIVSQLQRVFESWKLLQTPKMILLLLSIVGVNVVLILIGIRMGKAEIVNSSFIPLIIMTFASERFARKIDEEGSEAAISLLFSTLGVAFVSYLLFSSQLLQSVIMSFPELLLVVAAITLLLGKWIGLRIAEYQRFKLVKI